MLHCAFGEYVVQGGYDQEIKNLASATATAAAAGQQPVVEDVPASAGNIRLFGISYKCWPSEWSPKLRLKPENMGGLALKPYDGPDKATLLNSVYELQLTTLEMFPPMDPDIRFVLKDSYNVLGTFPRSYFVRIFQNNIQPCFVFNFPDHPWLLDMSGMRKSAYVLIKQYQSNDVWELHLKPSKDKTNIFGYICKASEMQRIVREPQMTLLNARRLPLVLDLDDTLVRLVGHAPGRYVPEEVAKQVPHRVRELRDGRKVVLTDYVHEFLDWVQNYFEISVCSLGDQNYVDMVIAVLDPGRTRIRGMLYSARQEWEFINKSPNPRRPPKDLLALYAFCTITDRSQLGSGYSLPLIVDDMTHMWPAEQHDNIIVVKERKNAPVWSVALFPLVQTVLHNVHTEFFRQLDLYQSGSRLVPPSAVACYKEYLRASLRDQISLSK